MANKKSTTKTDTAANTPATEGNQPATTEAPAAAAAAAPAKEPVVKVQQNGVTRPKDGSTTGRVWAIADEISSKSQAPATRKQVIDQVHAEGINTSTGATQYMANGASSTVSSASSRRAAVRPKPRQLRQRRKPPLRANQLA
jgi:hypothetical protein